MVHCHFELLETGRSRHNLSQIHELQDEIKALGAYFHVAEIQLCGTVLMVHEKHSKIGATGSQDGLVRLEVDVVDGDAAVTEETPLSLVVQLLEDVAAVTGPRHRL